MLDLRDDLICLGAVEHAHGDDAVKVTTFDEPRYVAIAKLVVELCGAGENAIDLLERASLVDNSSLVDNLGLSALDPK